MAELIRYGAYLPKYRAPLGEIQSFEGRPGRPRAKALATPGLDEDALTMAWEAAGQALGGATPQAIVSLTHSAPFGFRKMSVTRDVAEEIDAAELGVDSPEEFFNGDRVRNIGATRNRTTTQRPNPLAGRLGAGEIAID